MSAPGLGHDLRVLLGPPGLGAHDAATVDLRARARPSQQARTPRTVRRPPPPADEPVRQGWLPEPPGAREVLDLDRIAGRENLAQALVLRLLTPMGSLAALGHADYGSRLGELIGRRKTAALRGLCRLFILEAVRLDPRVEDNPDAIRFDPRRETPSTFVVEVAVRPVGGGDPVAVEVEVPL